MTRLLHIVFAVCTLCSVCYTPAFAQDYARLSERTIMGSARYVGMGGAMTAIGGDPSAVMDNTAGLGLYRRPEVTLTLDYSDYFMAPQTSVVFSVPTDKLGLDGVQFHNFMVSYHRVHSFYRNGRFASDSPQPSLGALFALTDGTIAIPYCADRYNAASEIALVERGYVNEYGFNWAMNISNRWYWGLGLRVHSFSMSSEGDYVESFNRQNADLLPYYNSSHTTLIFNGAGCSLSTGIIYRPTQWLRLGLGFETPSLGTVTTNTTGRLETRTDSLYWETAPNLATRASDLHMPLHLSTSVAFQISRYALLALQYDLRHNKYMQNMHSLRTGLEIVPFAGLYINGGYAFESVFSKTMPVVSLDPTLMRQDAYFQATRWQQYISCAVGYRGRFVMVQAAYQYRQQHAVLFAHENADPYNMNTTTHRIVLTVGWHGR